MVSQGDLEADGPDGHGSSAAEATEVETAETETVVLEWYGTLSRDGRSAEAAFVATDHRLIYVTEAAETAIEYARIRSVEAAAVENETSASGYRDLAVGAAMFAAVGLAIVVRSELVIGSVVGVIGVLIGVLLALDVVRNLHNHSGLMTLETPVHRFELRLTDGDPCLITTTANVEPELRRLVDPER